MGRFALLEEVEHLSTNTEEKINEVQQKLLDLDEKIGDQGGGEIPATISPILSDNLFNI